MTITPTPALASTWRTFFLVSSTLKGQSLTYLACSNGSPPNSFVPSSTVCRSATASTAKALHSDSCHQETPYRAWTEMVATHSSVAPCASDLLFLMLFLLRTSRTSSPSWPPSHSLSKCVCHYRSHILPATCRAESRALLAPLVQARLNAIRVRSRFRYVWSSRCTSVSCLLFVPEG